jgi:hypothetical protein
VSGTKVSHPKLGPGFRDGQHIRESPGGGMLWTRALRYPGCDLGRPVEAFRIPRSIDFLSVLKLRDGDSRLSRRFGAWLRVGSCFAALGQGGPGLTCAPQAVTASPAAIATLTAAFTSRSSHTPHDPHRKARTCSALGPS